MKKICLVSIGASHYRKLIYSMMDVQMGCDFIFGKSKTTVKSFDISLLRNAKEVKLTPIGRGRWYRMHNVIQMTKGYDVIVNDMGILCVTSWLLMIAALFRHQKLYHWSHGWYGRESIVKKYTKRLYNALSDGMFVYGENAIKLMIENGFNAKKLHLIHNSLDYDYQFQLRQSMSSSNIYREHFCNDNPVLLMIGRLNLRKHLDVLIKAVELLRNEGHHYNVVLIGSGEDENKIQDMVKERGLSSSVWMYGACYDENVNAQLIYNADICVVPGDIGLTAIHSMMFGCPCITHDYFPSQGPEYEAIRVGKTGDFYQRGNVNSLASCIEKWFAEHGDDRNIIRQYCYEEIDNNWNPHMQIEVLKSVIYKE